MKFAVVFASFFAMLVCSYLGLCWLVDPTALYGRHFFTPVVSNNRLTKQTKLALYLRDHRLDGLILGSSTSFPINPQQVDSLAGHTFFNYGVETATVEDYLAVYRWVQSSAFKPKVLVIGLDIFALSSNDRVDPRLKSTPSLFRAMEATYSNPGTFERIRLSLTRTNESLMIHHLELIVKALMLKVRPSIPIEVVEADGHSVYPKYEREREQGKFDREKEFRSSMPVWYNQYLDMESLSPSRMHLLWSLIAEANSQGVHVILWIPPLPHETVESLARTTHFLSCREEARAFLSDTAKKFPNIAVFDFSELRNFGGTESDFRDAGHMNRENTLLAVKQMFRVVPNGF